MGSLEISRIEDVYGAKMMYYLLLKKLGQDTHEFADNPWNEDWKDKIIRERGIDGGERPDCLYSLDLDTSDLIPKYDQASKSIILINLK